MPSRAPLPCRTAPGLCVGGRAAQEETPSSGLGREHARSLLCARAKCQADNSLLSLYVPSRGLHGGFRRSQGSTYQTPRRPLGHRSMDASRNFDMRRSACGAGGVCCCQIFHQLVSGESVNWRHARTGSRACCCTYCASLMPSRPCACAQHRVIRALL